MASSTPRPLDVYRPVTVAIDFGTSTSGYAYAFNKKGSKRPNSPFLNKWQMGSSSSSTDKTPTCLLLKPNKTFHKFGYDAEDEYAKLCDENKQKDYWYFDKFKMLLYQTKKLSRDTLINDAENRSMPATDVLALVIAHMKEHMLSVVRGQIPDIKDNDILYVLTVPAIWSDAAKQFMGEAATDTRVGIKDDQLRLVLEPEAASVYCRYTLSSTTENPDGGVELTALPVGHKYIIVDIGGGTVDIATHKVIEQNKVHEIHVSRGDDLGGQMFNTQFLEFLDDLIGHEVIKKWKTSENGDYLSLLRKIEGIKWKITKSGDDVPFKVESSLIDVVEEVTGKELDELVNRPTLEKSVEVTGNDKLTLSNEFVRRFFMETLVGVQQHIREIINEHGDIGTIFLVGGLAKAPYIQDVIGSNFLKQKLIVPEAAGVAVLRGAILLGNMPHMIAGRIARYHYGLEVCLPFEIGMHKNEYKFTRDGEDLCERIFKPLIKKGQLLKYGDKFETTTHIHAKQPERKQMEFPTCLYQSKHANPMYITDEGCTKVGGFDKVPPKGGWPDHCKTTVTLTVGEAELELHVKVLDKPYKQKIDFLQ